MAEYAVVCCVVRMGDASKVIRIARKYGAKGGTVSIGRGSVHSRLLDFLGLNEVRKEIVTIVAERKLASKVIRSVSEEMQFHKPHHGIAFSIPASEFTGSGNMAAKKKGHEVRKQVHKIIYVVVDKGRGNDVIEAANLADARGGTIINARGAGIHEVQKLFSVEIEPEKEEVFILTKTEKKDAIVESIRAHLQIDEPGNGIMFVLDVNETYGLHGE